MKDLKQFEVWFITGSQHLYGDDTLKQVAANAKEIAGHLDSSGKIATRVVWKPTVKTPDEIYAMVIEANNAPQCVGLVCWMHTFSPAKMWIRGLTALSKPYVHLHTQYNQDLPWASIDMDFMNLNQSAHGDREFGYIGTRLNRGRKVVVGHWKNAEVLRKIDVWSRAASAWHDAQGMKLGRIGDNMREVAVTEGNKVSAQIKLGWAVNTQGVGDVAALVNAATDAEVDKLMAEYKETYSIPDTSPATMAAIKDAARIELGLRAFMKEGGYKAFTTTFQDLHGLKQLPGLPAQRLMADGYGFGGEGDWKTAAMVRAMKVMAAGLKGGTSFMEDYTYHLEPGNEQVLGAHMLEVCPSIADGKPKIEVHPLGIGGKEPPARLVFDSMTGPAINASLIDLGNRFRLILNEVDAVKAKEPLPKLPVARVLWKARPSLATAAEAWILAGGAHHTGYSQAITHEHLEDFAEMAGIECVLIGADTQASRFRSELRWNASYFDAQRD
jgi:L-arabinose isomerase